MNTIQDNENQQDTKSHLLDKLSIGAVIGIVNDILDTINDNLIDKGFDCHNEDGSLKEVDDWKITYKMVADELRKHYR